MVECPLICFNLNLSPPSLCLDPKNYRVPRFLESLRAIMTDEGLVSFECKVIGYPTPELSWFKDGNQLQPGDVYELTGSKSLGKTLVSYATVVHYV